MIFQVVVGAYTHDNEDTYKVRLLVESSQANFQLKLSPEHATQTEPFPVGTTFFHRVIVSGLRPGIPVTLTVSDTNSSEEAFLCAPVAGAAVVFTVSANGGANEAAFWKKLGKTTAQPSMWQRLYENATQASQSSFVQIVHCGNQVYLDEAMVAIALQYGTRPLTSEQQGVVCDRFKAAYRKTWQAEWTQKCLRRFSHVMVLGEHEVFDHWAGQPVSADLLNVALDLFSVYQQILMGDPYDHMNDGHRWTLSLGQVQLVAVDVRSFRTPDAVLGIEQLTWLGQQLAQSKDTILFLPAHLTDPVWQGRMLERQSLIELLGAQRPTKLVVVSSDQQHGSQGVLKANAVGNMSQRRQSLIGRLPPVLQPGAQMLSTVIENELKDIGVQLPPSLGDGSWEKTAGEILDAAKVISQFGNTEMKEVVGAASPVVGALQAARRLVAPDRIVAYLLTGPLTQTPAVSAAELASTPPNVPTADGSWCCFGGFSTATDDIPTVQALGAVATLAENVSAFDFNFTRIHIPTPNQGLAGASSALVTFLLGSQPAIPFN